MTSLPRIYRSTDPGAPQLSGVAGSLVALLDAVLVTGYGVGSDFKPGAGWVRTFSATNKRVYRNNHVDGSGGYLRVEEPSATPGYGFARAYETMSDIDSGTGPAPTATQKANGILLLKSSENNGNSRPWEIIATDQAMYFFVNYYSLGASNEYATIPAFPFFAGDLESFVPGDKSHFMVAGNSMTTPAQAVADGLMYTTTGLSSAVSAASCYALRAYTQLPGSIPLSLANPSHGANGNAIGSTGGSFPDPVSGGALFERPLMREGAYLARGYLPGAYTPLHVRPFASGEMLSDIDAFPGRTFYVKFFNVLNNNSPSSVTQYAGQVLIDMTAKW
ncbi:hypothetical protein [Stenotrophomonas sp.]|uniref:hypothetical protein n=1 Tax=Stenotrophomonas sp. TaxID=69392 RepID=UPI002D303A42|nr:hypothetical protein [Stenotrophomonas sp.]HYQ23943.1 hypothetical protein [Stenotrophomonas sp.]